MMLRNISTTLAVLAVIALSGCGGGGGGSNPIPPGSGGGGVPPSGYTGHYVGAVQSNIDNGSTTFDVDSTSNILGTVKFSKLSSAVPLTGTISTDGKGTLTGHYSAGGYAYTVYGPFQQSPINANQYSATLAVHNDTTGANDANAALNVTRS